MLFDGFIKIGEFDVVNTPYHEDNYALPKNPKFDQFATLCLQLLEQYQQNLDEYTAGNFRNIVSDVSRYQEHHNNCYIRFDTEDFDFQQVSETVFIFQKACEQLGLMMMHSSAFEAVVFYPNGKTKPKHIASQLEAFVLSEKDQTQDSDELPSNKAKVQKMFKPKFDKLAHDFGFTPIEATHPDYEKLTHITKNVYIKNTPMSYITLELDTDKDRYGDYKIFCSLKYHILKIEAILSQLDIEKRLIKNQTFSRRGGISKTKSKLKLEQLLTHETAEAIQLVLNIDTYHKVKNHILTVNELARSRGETEESRLESFFRHGLGGEDYHVIILLKLTHDPRYEVYKTKFFELRQQKGDWRNGKITEEEKQKVYKNWHKIIEILDNLSESELESR